MRALVYGLTANLGGIETFMLSYVKELIHMGNKFDFLTSFSHLSVEDELRELGCNIYHITSKRDSYYRYKKELSKFMGSHAENYDAVWLNDVLFSNIDVLIYGKKYGIKKRILHAHNSGALGSKFRQVKHGFIKHTVKCYATDFWACSEMAAKWSFVDSDYKRAVVVNNAIDIAKYQYNKKIRSSVRKKLGITDEYVIGNIGRMDYQKNQMFLLKVFKEVLSQDKNSILMIVGTGSDENLLKQTAVELGIKERVMFLGMRKDVHDLLQAMDVFVLPSIFEGLGIVSTEAQASGLPCVLSDVLPEETNLTPYVKYLPLSEEYSIWSNSILSFKDIERTDLSEYVKMGGYDIKNEAMKVNEFLYAERDVK